MRIAFVSGNREKLPDAVIPFGLLYVIASTPKAHTTTLIDLCFEDEPCEFLKQRLIEFHPDVVPGLGPLPLSTSPTRGFENV